MKKILVPLILASLSVLPSLAAASSSSYAQLLEQISAPPPAAPAPAPKAVPGQRADGRYWVTIAAPDKRSRTRLLEEGFDIVVVSKDRRTVSGIADKALLDRLSSRAVSVLSSRPLADYSSGVSRDFPQADAVYHNYQETTDLLRQLAAKNPDIASVFSIGKTVQGRDIWCLRVNTSVKGNGPSDKPGAFFMGNIHAREHLADEVPLLFASWLMDHRNDPEIKNYISTLDIFIIPMANPDGVEYDIKDGQYQYFRKNMEKNSDGSFGVDLNPNFDSWWCREGASHYPPSDTYCGPKAFSEPESRDIRDFFLAHKNIKTHISYHSYASEILYPYGGSDEDVADPRDKAALVKIADQMAKLTGYTAEKSSALYIATGDSCDWAYATDKVLAFTVELEGDGFYPGPAVIKGTVDRNVKAAVYLLSMTANPYQ